MAEVVKFVAADGERAAVVDVLRAALAAAEAGRIVSVAVATVERGEAGPTLNRAYTGEQHFASLVASVASLAFDLQWGAYEARYGLGE